MELTQLRFFLEVAKTEHMTKSAEKLHIAQPSLTQAIHKLEEELGVPLFDHRGRNITLTEYGRFLSEKLTPVLAEIDRLPFELRRMAKTNSETIHISVLAASALVTEAIIRYKQQNAQVHFQLSQNRSSEVCDIEITTRLPSPAPKEQPGRRTYARTEQIFLAVPDQGKYQGRHSIALNEVMDEGFICLSGSRQFRLVCDKLCRDAGFRPNIIFESDNPTAVINMVGSNMGVGFYPEFSWGKIESRHIRLLEIEDADFRRELSVSAVLPKNGNRYVSDFFQFLTKYIEKRAKSRKKND